MIVDVRTYRVKPGKMPQELDLYAKRGLAPQVRHLGPPLAYLHGRAETSTRSCTCGCSMMRLTASESARP